MANLKSAIKRIRQNKKRREHNRHKRSGLNTAIKHIRIAVQKKDKKEAESSLQIAIPLIHKAGQKRLIHPNNASRKISRLTTQVNALK